MKGFLSVFQDSAKEFSKIRTLTVTAILIALYVILEGIFSISIGPYIKINFAFLALAIIGMLYGPYVTMSAAVICDILGFLVKPQGGFLIAFTLIAMVQGLIYGVLLYKKQGRQLIKSVVIARFLDSLICNIILNTLALIHYGFIPASITNKAMLTRIIKNAIEYPIYVALLIGVLSSVLIIYNRTFKRNRI